MPIYFGKNSQISEYGCQITKKWVPNVHVKRIGNKLEYTVLVKASEGLRLNLSLRLKYRNRYHTA